MKKRIISLILAVIMLFSAVTVCVAADVPEDLQIYDIYNEVYSAALSCLVSGYPAVDENVSLFFVLDYLLYADKFYELGESEDSWEYTYDEFMTLVKENFVTYDEAEIKAGLIERDILDVETDVVKIGAFGGFGGAFDTVFDDMLYVGNGKYKVNYFVVDLGCNLEEDPESYLEGLVEGYDYIVYEDSEYKYGIITDRHNIFFDVNGDTVRFDGFEECDYHILWDNIYYKDGEELKSKHRISTWGPNEESFTVKLHNTPTAVDAYSETEEVWFDDDEIKFELEFEKGYSLDRVDVYCGWELVEHTEKDGVYTAKGVSGDAVYIDVYTSFEASEKFNDVKESNWFNAYVSEAVQYGLFKGTSETEFSPNESMTRGMFATVLFRMDGEYFEGDIDTAFEDVDSSKYYGPAIAWAYENGVVNGMSESEFGVNLPITREQMCTMLIRYAVDYAEFELKEDTAKKTFSDDASIHDWAKDAVYACQRAGIINGMTDTVFAPQGTATRAQVAKILSVFYTSYIHVGQ